MDSWHKENRRSFLAGEDKFINLRPHRRQIVSSAVIDDFSHLLRDIDREVSSAEPAELFDPNEPLPPFSSVFPEPAVLDLEEVDQFINIVVVSPSDPIPGPAPAPASASSSSLPEPSARAPSAAVPPLDPAVRRGIPRDSESESDCDPDSDNEDFANMSYPTASDPSTLSGVPIFRGENAMAFRHFLPRARVFAKSRRHKSLKLGPDGRPTPLALLQQAADLRADRRLAAELLMDCMPVGTPGHSFILDKGGTEGVLTAADEAGKDAVEYLLDLLEARFGRPSAQERYKLTHMVMCVPHSDQPVPSDEGPLGLSSRIRAAHEPFDKMPSGPLLTEKQQFDMWWAGIPAGVRNTLDPIYSAMDEDERTISALVTAAQNVFDTQVLAAAGRVLEAGKKGQGAGGAGGGPSTAGGLQRQVSNSRDHYQDPAFRDPTRRPPTNPGHAPYEWCRHHGRWCGHSSENCNGVGKRWLQQQSSQEQQQQQQQPGTSTPGGAGGVKPQGTVKQTVQHLLQAVTSLAETVGNLQLNRVHGTMGQGGQQQQLPPSYQQRPVQQQQQVPPYQQQTQQSPPYQQRQPQQRPPWQQQQLPPSSSGRDFADNPDFQRPCLFCGDIRHGKGRCWARDPRLVDKLMWNDFRPPTRFEEHYLGEAKRYGLPVPTWAGTPRKRVQYTHQGGFHHTAFGPDSPGSDYASHAAGSSRAPSEADTTPFTQPQGSRPGSTYSGYSGGLASSYLPPFSNHMTKVRFTLGGVGDERYPEEPTGTSNRRQVPTSFGRVPDVTSSTPVPSATRAATPALARPLPAATAALPVVNPADRVVNVLVEPSVTNVSVIVRTCESLPAAGAEQLPPPLHATQLEASNSAPATPQVLASALRKERHPNAFSAHPTISLADLRPGDPGPELFRAKEHSDLVDVEELKSSYTRSIASLYFFEGNAETGLSIPTGEDRLGAPAVLEKALIDTGAEVCVADIDVIRQFGLPITARNDMSISTSTGAVEPVLGSVEDLICTLAAGTHKQVQFRTTFLCMHTTDKSFQVILSVHVMKQLGLWADPLLRMVFYRPFLHDGKFDLTLACLPFRCVQGGQHPIKLTGCKLHTSSLVESLPAPEFCMGRIFTTTAVDAAMPPPESALVDAYLPALMAVDLQQQPPVPDASEICLAWLLIDGSLDHHPDPFAVFSNPAICEYALYLHQQLLNDLVDPTPASPPGSYPMDWDPYSRGPSSMDWDPYNRSSSLAGTAVDFSKDPVQEDDIFYDAEGEVYGQLHFYDCQEEFSPSPLPPQVFPAANPPVTVIGKVGSAISQGWGLVRGGISATFSNLVAADPCISVVLTLLLLCATWYRNSLSVAWHVWAGVAVTTSSCTVLSFVMWRRWYSSYLQVRCKTSTHKHRLKLPRPREPPPPPPAPKTWYSGRVCLAALKIFAVLWVTSALVMGAAATGAAAASVSSSGGLRHFVHGTSLYGAVWEPPFAYVGHNVSADSFSWDPDSFTTPSSVHSSWSHVRSTVPDGVQYHTRADAFTKDPGGWIMGNHPDMTEKDRQVFRDMIASHKDDFAYDLSQLGRYRGAKEPMRINLQHDNPIRTPNRRYSHLEAQVRDEKCRELLQHGIIVESSSTKYVSRCTVAAKKDLAGEWTEKRFCVDYRKINEATEPDKYGLHLPEELFDQVRGSRFFTKIDLRSGFHQIPLHPDDQVKTCFWWDNKVYQYTCLPFGLRNAPAHFQRCMDDAIAVHRMGHCAFCYVDDLLVYSATAADHIKHVDAAFNMLHDIGLRIHPDKSVFGTDVIEYLGHNVSAYGVTPHEAKVAAIKALPSPKNLIELQSVLGFLNYYRVYIPDFASIAQPLYLLLKKDQPFVWTDAQQLAYEALKASVCVDGRALRRFDPLAETLVYTDWSTHGIGAVLAQKADDGTEYMVACISRSLNKHEANYASYYGEMLAAVLGVKTLRPYLHGIHFALVSDHRPLTYLMQNENLTGQHARWALAMQEFDFTIEYRKGLEHINADVPSRFPLPSHEDGTGARLDPDPADMEEVSPSIPPPPVTPEAALHDTVSVHRLHWASTQPAVSPMAQELMPDSNQLLLGHLGMVCDEWDSRGLDSTLEHADQQRVLECARQWVRHAVDTVGPSLWQISDPAPTLINGISMGKDFWSATRNEGIILMETFAGIATGLEMCIRNGIKVQRYLYCDKDPVAKHVAQHRALLLHEEFPTLLPLEALHHAFHALPDDIHQITPDILSILVKEDGPAHWLYVAGWECQDLSPAGVGRGLAGRHSSTFHACIDVLRNLQLLMPDRLPAYLLENTFMQVPYATPQVQRDFRFLCEALGTPVHFDALQVGSHAHRVRNYWTNLAPSEILQRVFSTVNPELSSLQVQDILEPGRHSAPVHNPSMPPQFPAHPAGYKGPRRALPTLVSTPGSYAFRPGKAGSIYDDLLEAWTEPLAVERERALGFLPNTTNMGISEAQRRQLLGRCMDINAVTGLVAIAAQIAYRAGHVHTVHLTHQTLFHPPAPPPHASFAQHVKVCLLSMLAECDDSALFPAVHVTSSSAEAPSVPAVSPQAPLATDIWQDAHTLSFLHMGHMPEGLDDKQRKRVHRRAQSYRAEFKEGATLPFNLSRVLRDGSLRTVPAPGNCLAIAKRMHESTGHFGEKRTRHFLMNSYWWDGIATDVRHVVRSCSQCDRINHSGLNTRDAALQPLLAEGLFYRWGVDLFGPLHRSSMGNTYVLVAIEHFSKHIELIPLPDKKAMHTAYALSQVLGRFGAPAEVVTDLGKEFMGEFEELLQTCFIDHRTTSPNHPAANGLAERAVQPSSVACANILLMPQLLSRIGSSIFPGFSLVTGLPFRLPLACLPSTCCMLACLQFLLPFVSAFLNPSPLTTLMLQLLRCCVVLRQ